MNRQEILERAIQKAIDGGWKAEINGSAWLRILEPSGDLTGMYAPNTWGSPSVIFNHDFAKALWGLDRLVCDSCHVDVKPNDKECWNCSDRIFVYEAFQNTRDNLPNWQHHLQQMVIADDPIKYLGDNLPN